jgi:dihydroorotase
MDASTIDGLLVFPERMYTGRITIHDGVIAGVEERPADGSTATLIFPGFVDIHVHAREYPKPSADDPNALKAWEAACRKETFASCGAAAIHGGITLFAAMPNDPVPPDSAERYQPKVEVARSSPCPVIVFAAITPHSEPWEDLPYKLYLDRSSGSVSFSSWTDVEAALKRYRGCRVFFHAEDPEILQSFPSSAPRWRNRPPEAEIKAVDRILEFTSRLALRTHICHVSTQAAVERIVAYNRHASHRVTCEVTPHHLFFSVDENGSVLAANGAPVAHPELLECNPPLRTEADRRYLLNALQEGTIDALASDHAPHTLEDKKNGAPGMPHLDTLGAFAGWLMKGCSFPPQRIAAILSTEPARIIGAEIRSPISLSGISPGSEATLTVLDFSGTTTVPVHGSGRPVGLATRCGWSPFEGVPLPARVFRTVIHGQLHAPGRFLDEGRA